MKPTQMSWLGSSAPSIVLWIDPNHLLVRLTQVIDWDLLQVIAQERRALVVRSQRGSPPHYRANLGAVIVRSLKSCTLRETEDLCRNYMPARYMCELQNSDRTPDHDTIWEFEVMLGQEGLSEINRHVLKMAEAYGFANVRGLCSDTTAQEGKIPYPNEASLMGFFARSVGKSFQTMSRLARGFKLRIREKVKEIKVKVREHRLFAKTKETRLKVAAEMSFLSRQLLHTLLEMPKGVCLSAAKGAEKKALNQIGQLSITMSTLIEHIDYWIKTGWVYPRKIVSLFQPDLRAIKRGKIGKQVEFGLKWGLNQIRGGYIHLFMLGKMMSCDADYAVESIRQHILLFGQPPQEFGFDRGGWSAAHIAQIKKLGVKRVAIAPRGQQAWLVSNPCRERMQVERAQTEGKFGTIKQYGFNKPKETTTPGMMRAARRAELRFNLTRLAKDLISMTQSRAVAVS
jgi:hypothetical protein